MPNATLKLVSGRQCPMFAEIAFDHTHFQDSAVPVPVFNLPFGAQIIGGAVIVDTAFDSTTNVLDVGDSVVGNRYVNDVNLKATGRTALVPTGYVSDGAAVWATPVATGSAPTVGAGRIQIQYVIKDRATENQPN